MIVPARAPSVTLPLSYLLSAAAAFVLAALGVAWLAPELAGHYYHPRVFALVHTVTLGWVTVAIVGASYQIIPIVIERPLWSERLARWQLGVLAIGIPGMVAHFFIAEWFGLAWAAGMVTLALGAHVANVALTVRGLPRWTFTARLVALGYGGLALTALTGLLLGLDKAWQFLPGGALTNAHAHAHVALLAWVVPMVIGVAARVYPMFLLSPEPGGPAGTLQLWGLALGVPTLVAGLALARETMTAAGALAVVGALAGHAWWVGQIVASRRRPVLDRPIRFLLTGTVFLAAAAALGLSLALDVVAGPRFAVAYIVLGLGGWVSLTIVGMILKIVPFLVWYRVYGPRVGRTTVPTLAALSSPYAEAVAYWALTSGVIVLAVAVTAGWVGLIRAAGALLVVGAFAFAGAVARVSAHLVRRSRPATPIVASRLEAEHAS